MSEREAINHIALTMRDARAKAIERYKSDFGADKLLTSLRRAADDSLQALLRICPLPKGAALAAVGGYGRGELYPYSDVDILVLLSRDPNRAEEALLGNLVAAMWDVGLEPGYSVRTLEQCISEAACDITVETSLLESRWVAGSRSLVKTFTMKMTEQIDARKFFQGKQAEMQQRHARYQDTPYALEPNCKESPGGLRDLQVIMWMARAAGFGKSWQQIAAAGLLTKSEARELKRAEQAFKRLRIELHLLTKRREDKLLFDLQHGLAMAYGIEPSPTRRASEILMQRYYWAARLVTQLNTLLVQNIEERLFPIRDSDTKIIDAHFLSRHHRLDIARDNVFEQNPSLLLKVFLVMQQHPELTGLSGKAMRAILHNRDRIDARFRSDPQNKKIFLQILQQPEGLVHALRRMTMLNILPNYLPVFRRIVGQMQHDLFHVYTVDQHTLAVIRNLRRFTMPEHAQEYPLASHLMAGFERHWLLYVAALFHDIAKGRGADHSSLGAIEVAKFAGSHSLDKNDTELVVFLVSEHLMMSQVAQKQDLSDPQVIQAFATKVKDTRHLIGLYLLTIADIRGTSPKVWNAWKGKLLENLFHQTKNYLGGGTTDSNSVLQQRTTEAIRLIKLAGIHDEARERFWSQLDVAYFLRHEASDIAWHTRHLNYRSQTDSVIVKARPTEGSEGLEVMVYTKDVADLFARICIFFGARSMNIQDAKIHTTRHGYALDSFIVLNADDSADYRTLAPMIEHELSSKLLKMDSDSLDNRVETGKRRSRMSKAFPVPPRVQLFPDEGSENWRLEIVATDRPGLLGQIAKVFVDSGIGVLTAKVMTLGDRVEDVLVINGECLKQPRTQRQFERALLDVLTETPSHAT